MYNDSDDKIDATNLFGQAQKYRYAPDVNNYPAIIRAGAEPKSAPKPKTVKLIDWVYSARAAETDRQKRPARPTLFYCYSDGKGHIVSSDGFRLHVAPSDLACGFYSIAKNTPSPANDENACNFPDYTMIVPKEKKTDIVASVTKSAMWQALQACAVFAKEKDSANIVYMTLYRTAIILESESEGDGNGSDKGGYTCVTLRDGENGITAKSSNDKDGFLIAFNYDYMLDVLTGWGNDTVIDIRLSSPSSPMFINSPYGNNAQFAVLMPMSIGKRDNNHQPAQAPCKAEPLAEPAQPVEKPVKPKREKSPKSDNPYTAYIAKIKNTNKKAYALAYYDWLCNGETGAEPEHTGIGAMAAQDVRMRLRDLHCLNRLMMHRL